MATKAQSNTTTDHDEIRRWAEARGAAPACVKGTGGPHDIGMLRLDFPGYGGEDSLQHICWEDWFQKFDERQLALLYQEPTAGGAESNFNKLVSRETASEDQARSHRSRATKASASHGRSTSKKTNSTTQASSAKKTSPTKKVSSKKASSKKSASR